MAAAALTLKDCTIEYCLSGTTWTPMSTWDNEVKIPDGKRKTGEVYNFTDDVGTLGSSKREPIPVEVGIIYDENTTAPYWILQPYYKAGSSIGLRVTPTGRIAGNHIQYTSNNVTTPSVGNVIQSFGYPSGKAEDATPQVLKMVLLTPEMVLTTSTS